MPAMSDDDIQILYQNTVSSGVFRVEENIPASDSSSTNCVPMVPRVSIEQAHNIKSQARLHIKERYKELKNSKLTSAKKHASSFRSRKRIPKKILRTVDKTCLGDPRLVKRKSNFRASSGITKRPGSGTFTPMKGTHEDGHGNLTNSTNMGISNDTFCNEKSKFLVDGALINNTSGNVAGVSLGQARKTKPQTKRYMKKLDEEPGKECQSTCMVNPKKNVNFSLNNDSNKVVCGEMPHSVNKTGISNSKRSKRKSGFFSDFPRSPCVRGSSDSAIKKDANENNDHEMFTNVMKMVELCDTYCLEKLNVHSEVVLANNFQHLINKEEAETIQSFFNMNSECQKMYIGMYRRKYRWRKLSNYQYNPTIMKNINILLDKGFLSMSFPKWNSPTGLPSLCVDGLLEVLKINEMKKLCESLGIEWKSKKKFVQEILQCLLLQKPIGISVISTDDIWRRVTNIVGHCFIMSPTPYRIFWRMYFLFFLKCNVNDKKKDDSQFSGTNESNYPEYSIDSTEFIFSTRNELLRFHTAADLWIEFSELVKNKEWIRADETLGIIRKNFKTEVTNCSSSVSVCQLPLCIREYTAGTIYTYALWKGIDVLKKLKKEEQVIQDLNMLLCQRIYLPYVRGRWYEHLIRILQTSGQLEEVAKVIDSAMKDIYVDEEALYMISCHSEEILRKKKKISLEVKDILQCVPPVSSLKCGESNIIKVQTDVKTDCKQFYVPNENGEEIVFSSIEELIKNNYCPRLFKNGMYDGNNLLLSLFGVLFWDMIYEYPVKYAFIRQCQIIPLDLNSGEFYRNRKDVIDKKLFEMTHWEAKDIASWVKEIYNKQNGKISVVHWKWFPESDYILNIINCVGWDTVLKICERIVKYYRVACRGFPALFVWTSAQNKYKFVEVQYQNVSMETNQKLWRNFLLEINANVEICYIKPHKSKTGVSTADSSVQQCSNVEKHQETTDNEGNV